MADVMLALGDFRFSVDTAAFDSLQRTSGYNWARQDRVGAVPAAQWVGPDADSISLRGTIYPHYAGGLEQVPNMRREAARGRPLRLVDGQGNNHGFWTIEKVREDESVFLPGGAPRKIGFRLQLVYYGASAP